MNKKIIVSKSIVIETKSDNVWDVLTNPNQIKKYLFGTETITNWEVGEPIIFQGEYNGQKYQDKGIVLKFDKNKLLEYKYWSSFSGLEDKPENYITVTYNIDVIDKSKVRLTWHQEVFKTKEALTNTLNKLEMILIEISKILKQ